MRLYKFHSRAEDRRVQEQAKEKASPWKLGGLTPVQLAKRVYYEIDEDEVFTRSAALSFYFVAALVPMLFFMMAMLGLFGRSHDLESSLFAYAGRFLPTDAYALLQKTLKEITTNSTGSKLAFGLLLALWSGSGGIRSIMDALNRCYHIQERRPYWKQILISVILTVVIAGLTISALVIVLYGGAIAQFVGNHIGLSKVALLAWEIAQWPIALFFVVLSFAIMYYWLPDAKQQWAWITPGSLIGVLLWIGASLGFRVYLHFSNTFSKTYGSLGAAIILLYWLYITGFAILIGGEINSEIENAAARSGHPEAKAEGEKVA
jgi:membrane protein